MSNSSLAFAFDEPSPPVVVMAAQTMASELAAGRALSRSDVTRIMTEHFGGSDALGRWSVRDAHAATELAQVQYLRAADHILLSASIDEAAQFFCSLDVRLPTQTNRSDEQIEWQQFATPPRLAWLAARACALDTGELVLEPSAGTGMLAVWAAKAGSRLALNEISPLRRDCLNALFPDCLNALFPAARVAGHDAELIDELLDPAITPSVVLMNPPYSHGIERGHDIYVSVPETYAARAISFFATTKKGFVYKVACRVEQIPATQVFVTNPAIAKNRAADWESQTPLETSAVRLIQPRWQSL